MKLNINIIIGIMVNISVALIVFIFLISPIIKDNKIIFGLIVLDGLISWIGYILLITKGNKIKVKG